MRLSEAVSKRIDILSEATEECELNCTCSVCLELNERHIQLQAIKERRADDKEGKHTDILQGKVKKTKAKDAPTQSYTKSEINKWLKVARQNGIAENTFRYRALEANWNIERAATQPTQKRKNSALSKQKIEVKHLKEAKVKVYTQKDDLIQRAIKVLEIDYVEALKRLAKESINNDDFDKSIEAIMVLHQFKELEEKGLEK